MMTRQILGLVMPAPRAQPMVATPELIQNASVQPESAENSPNRNTQ